jgi:hypothetical protein
LYSTPLAAATPISDVFNMQEHPQSQLIKDIAANDLIVTVSVPAGTAEHNIAARSYLQPH